MLSIEKLLCDLIALPTVNPAFLPVHDERAGEQRAAEYLAAYGRQVGLEIEWQPVLPQRANLLLRQAPTGKVRKRVILAPHLDTVGGDATDEGLFNPRKEAGRLYGRGACDTKGSVAAMLHALARLARSGPRPKETEIIFAGLIDEESGQAGSRALVASGFKADLAIVGEPTRLRVVTAHKGDVWLRLETRGKAAHGARPELGRNAVLAMARVVELLETQYGRLLRKRPHQLLGCATINVGTIHGGTQPNIVPARCMISIDRRTLPGETEQSVRREISSFLRGHNVKASLASYRTAPCGPLETDPELPLVGQFLRQNRQSRPAGVNFFCDAAVLSQGGIPSIVFGPGDIAQAHTAREWISLRSLERGALILYRFLASLP